MISTLTLERIPVVFYTTILPTRVEITEIALLKITTRLSRP